MSAYISENININSKTLMCLTQLVRETEVLRVRSMAVCPSDEGGTASQGTFVVRNDSLLVVTVRTATMGFDISGWM